MKPDFGLFVDQPASIGEALTEFANRGREPDRAIAFDTTGLIRRTQEALQPFQQHRLEATAGWDRGDGRCRVSQH